MKPWEETWTWRDAGTVRVDRPPMVDGHSGMVLFPAGSMLVKYDPGNYSHAEGAAKGRLAAAAPEMARMLLSYEWRFNVDGVTPEGGCPSCDESRTVGHADDCPYVALLRKAGVR